MNSFLSWWYSNTASIFSSTSSINNSPPRKVHVGLSIDSDSCRDSETSSLSDFEEGMPLWAKDTPPRLLIPNTATQMSTPIGFQIRMPKRGAALSLDTTHETLTQRTFLKPNLSLPILNLNDYREIEGVRLQQRQPQEGYILESSSLRTTKFPQRLLKLFFALMAMGMVAASVNQQLYTEIMNEIPADTPAAASSQPNFPNYHLLQQQQPNQPQSFASVPSNQQRRSNLALARSQEKLPVFGQVGAEDRELQQDSPSDSWISWLGGCAFCLVLLETGWKGYRQSRLSHEARRR
jgi:hypothetical protein